MPRFPCSNASHSVNQTDNLKSIASTGKTESGVRTWFAEFWRLAPFTGAALLVAGTAGAAETRPPSTNSAPEISLEDLVNLKITSVSKKEEKLKHAAAAISVLSNDEIRRSGATSVAEALRLIPGQGLLAFLMRGKRNRS